MGSLACFDFWYQNEEEEMKLKFLILATLFFIFTSINPVWAQCPQDTVDRGVCDTLSVELLDFSKQTLAEPFYFVRVPIYVTHDLLSAVDSIGSFVIPLHFTHTNPAKYCSLSSYWNANALSGSALSQSVFRHLVDPITGDTIYNRILQLYQQDNIEWGPRLVRVTTSQTNPDSNWFRLAIFSAYWPGQWWWEGEKVLLATMTFKIEDSMTIRIDTTFWPPNSHLSFWRMDSKGYTPRTNLPLCIDVNSRRPMCSEFCGVPGDANWDGMADLVDVIYMIKYLFINEPPPLYCDCADVNCDGIINIEDVIYYINYVFIDGPRLRSCIDCY
jgi:hypothetical protein